MKVNGFQIKKKIKKKKKKQSDSTEENVWVDASVRKFQQISLFSFS